MWIAPTTPDRRAKESPFRPWQRSPNWESLDTRLNVTRSTGRQKTRSSGECSARARSLVARAAGFTMLELLICMAIMMVLAAIAIPQVMNAVYLSRIRGAADDVSALAQQARAIAEKNNATIPLYLGNNNVGPSNSSGAFISCTNGACPGGTAWVVNDSYIAYSGSVTNSANPPVALTQANLGFTPLAAGNTLYFTPLGTISSAAAGTYTSQGFAFYLSDTRNNWAAVSVSPTGRSKVWLYTAGSWH